MNRRGGQFIVRGLNKVKQVLKGAVKRFTPVLSLLRMLASHPRFSLGK